MAIGERKRGKTAAVPYRPTSGQILSRLRSAGDPAAVLGMARYGIKSKKVLGVSMPFVRRMAAELGHDHTLALKLWSTGILEARTLAALVDDPAAVTVNQMESWVLSFDNWAICDGCCCNLFDRTPYAWRQARKWCRRKEEFVKRAGFVIIAALAVHDKSARDSEFIRFLSMIQLHADDDRVYVKKAVNWALRQIGKRNVRLWNRAVQTARQIQKRRSRSARWIAADALRELTSQAVKNRLVSTTARRAGRAKR